MTTKLDNLLAKIKNDMTRRDKSKDEWVAATLDLCIHLAEARAEFADNVSFGQWFDTSGIVLNEHDRAAAVTMGKEPKLAGEVLAATDSRSLQLICRNEFRLVSANKTTKPTTKPRPPNPVNDVKRQRAFEAYDRIKADTGQTPSYEKLGKEAGVSATIVRAVLTTREAEEKVRADFGMPPRPPPLSVEEEIAAYSASLPPGLRKKFDVNIAAYRRKLEKTFDARVAEKTRIDHQQWREQTGIAFFMKRLDDAERVFTRWPYSVMRKAEYNLIMRCLHPDTAHSRSPQELAEAFRLFTYYKLKMINDDEERIAARRELHSMMPKTLAEMLARKKTKTV